MSHLSLTLDRWHNPERHANERADAEILFLGVIYPAAIHFPLTSEPVLVFTPVDGRQRIVPITLRM